MNIWNAIDILGSRITDERLRAAWARMLETRSPDDCEYAAYVAEYRAVGETTVYFRIANRAADYALAEQRLNRALIEAGVQS